MYDEYLNQDNYFHLMHHLNSDKNSNLPFREESISKVNIIFTREDAAIIAEMLGIDFSKSKFTMDQFLKGINVELEHGTRFPESNISNNNPVITGKIALAHLLEFPDYYTRLEVLEEEAKKFWQNK